MSTTAHSITINPAPLLHEESFSAGGISYDPDLGMLTYQLDRTRAEEQVQFILPTTFEDYMLSAAVPTATRENPVVDVGDLLLLPRLTMDQEYAGEIAFDPTPADATAGKIKVKIRVTIRVRPTGGG